MKFNRQEGGRPMRENGIKRTQDRRPEPGREKKDFKSKILTLLDNQKTRDEQSNIIREADDNKHIDYAVLEGGNVLRVTKSIEEAKNLAKSINTDVWLRIEGSFVNKI
jgi:hypothetical protein